MTILIIRHAEKPDDGPHLSPRGHERARALVGLFRSCFRAPDRLVAAADTAKSFRPRETLNPLAAAFNLNVEADTIEVDEIATRLRMSAPSELTLISWRHDSIPALAKALGAEQVPDLWHEAVYDRIWRLMKPELGLSQVVNMPQALLPGDSLQ